MGLVARGCPDALSSVTARRLNSRRRRPGDACGRAGFLAVAEHIFHKKGKKEKKTNRPTAYPGHISRGRRTYLTFGGHLGRT
jgi:hypothetical protein